MAKLTRENIKHGDVFYDVHHAKITKHTYVCLHPNNKSYHIVLDQNEDPARWYNSKLDGVLALGIRTYTEALEESIKHQQARLDMFKSFLKEEQEGKHGDC